MKRSECMNDNDKQRLIHNYLSAADKIQRGLEHQDTHQSTLENDQLIFEKVIEELGLSKEQQENLKTIAMDLLNTAQDHFFKQEFYECVELGERAHQLLPYDVRPLELLLRVHTLPGSFHNPEKVKQYAQSILHLEPHHEEAQKAMKQPIAKIKRSMVPVVVSVAGLSIFSGAVASFLLVSEPMEEISFKLDEKCLK